MDCLKPRGTSHSCKVKKEYARIDFIYAFFLFLFIILSIRIAYLGLFKKNFFKELAQRQYYRLIPLEGKRGPIFDRKGRVLATVLTRYSIFADPHFIKNPAFTAKLIAAALELPQRDLEEKLRKKKRFVWLKRKVSWDEKESIMKFKLKGIGFIREYQRFYPQEELASSCVGVVDVDNKGLEGIEFGYDQYLRGKAGLVRVLTDSFSQEVLLTPEVIYPQDGAYLRLTIDAQLQYWVEHYLKETVKKFSAKEASALIIDSASGQILALANWPSFNPNVRQTFLDAMRNRAITDMFEPGSVFKVVTLIAALSENKFSEADTIFCENGEFKIPGTTLNDWKPYGTLTFEEVFKKSSNIGVAKIANSLGKQTFYSYMKKLGFGEKTGIDMPGEIRGEIKPPMRWSNTSSYIMPIGQELGTNLMQLSMPFVIIANGGYAVKPYIVKDIRAEGFSKEAATVKKRVVSARVAERAKNILIGVVREGTGKLADVKGFTIGGKTGTAQKYDPNTHQYSPTKYKASFVGFITDEKFSVVIGVTVDEPRGSHFGGVVAAPLFKNIAERTAKYLARQKPLETNEATPAFSLFRAKE